jgi:hypothetical protein
MNSGNLLRKSRRSWRGGKKGGFLMKNDEKPLKSPFSNYFFGKYPKTSNYLFGKYPKLTIFFFGKCPKAVLECILSEKLTDSCWNGPSRKTTSRYCYVEHAK